MINKSFVMVMGILWFSMALVVCVGIYFTRSGSCLFFMLIPTLVTIHTVEEEDEDAKDSDRS